MRPARRKCSDQRVGLAFCPGERPSVWIVTRLLAAALLAAGLLTASAAAKPKPQPRLTGSVRIVFSGSAHEEGTDVQRYVFFSDNSCYQRETISEQASMSWTATWTKVRVAALTSMGSLVPASPEPTATVTGTDIKDGCDTPAETPADWFAQTTCRDSLVA